MIITIDDKINCAKPLYYQSLVLLFLPCEKFTEYDTDNKMHIITSVDGDEISAVVRIDVNGKLAECKASERATDDVKRGMKNLVGRTVLASFNKIFDRKPPWGISTGVKPIKLAKQFIDVSGKDEAFDILTKEYLLDERKARLCIEAYEKERYVMRDMTHNACSVYVSIPFCPTRCNYCSFVSCTTPRFLSLIPQYLEKLYTEIAQIGKTVKEAGLSIKSIYVGGGTPAILDEKQTDMLLTVMQKCLPYTNDVEFTFEAGRPDCITKEKLIVLKEHGIGRISVNPQTTNDDVLKNVGRHHTTKQFYNAFELARSVGFDYINTDLIASLPGDNLESFKKSINDMIALSAESVTVHSFTLKKSSVFRTAGQTDVTRNFDQARKMTDYAYDTLKQNGFFPYYVYRQKNTVGDLDNTGYSKKGFESIYNIVMMGERHTVLSAGAGSVTKLVDESGNVSRMFAPKYPYEYLDETKYKSFDKKTVLEFYKNNYERK